MQLATMPDLQSYLAGVLGRAYHHAPNVTDVVAKLVPAVLTYAEPDSLSAREYRGTPTNMLYFRVKGQWFAFRFAHTAAGGAIELIERYGKRVRATFTNADSQSRIFRVFLGL